MSHMKTLDVAEFRKTVTSLTEPVQVTKYRKPIGTWIPGEGITQPAPPASAPKPVAPKPEPYTQTIGFSKAQQAGRKEPVAKKRW